MNLGGRKKMNEEESQDAKQWEKAFGKICKDNNISIAKRGHDKIQALGIDEYYKPLILQLKEFVNSKEEDAALKVGIISLYAKKESFEKEEEDSHLEKLREEVWTSLMLKKPRAASELLVEEIKKKHSIYTTKDDIKPEIWVYDEGIYIPNGRSVIKAFCRMVLKEAYTVFIANEVIAKIEGDTQISQTDFFENKYVNELPVENGILNVLTKEITPFTHKKIFFTKLPVKFNEDSKCPSIDKFLKDILKSEEDIVVAYELMGAGLYKEYFTEKAGMLVGSGRNGKSKFLELTKRLVGAENCCSVPLRAMKEDNSSLCELHGRLFNLAGDIGASDLKDTGCFKQTIGRDLITAHRKFLRDLIFVNYSKHIFACNELPRVYDTTDGFWTKWVLLEFPYQFLGQKELDVLKDTKNKKLRDEHIIEKITTPEEMSGLLNRAIEGLARLISQKNFSQTKGTKEIKDFWIRHSDSFSAFCIDTIEEKQDAYISKKELRRRFHVYCKKHSIKGASDRAIKATLEDRYGVYDGRKSINDEMTYVWEGVKFKSDLS